MYSPVAVVQVGTALLQVFYVQLDQPGAHVVAGYAYPMAAMYPLMWDAMGSAYFMFGAVSVYLNHLAWKN